MARVTVIPLDPPNEVTITLTDEEAQLLRILTANFGGAGPIRTLMNSIASGLSLHGYSMYGKNVETGTGYYIGARLSGEERCVEYPLPEDDIPFFGPDHTYATEDDIPF